MARFKSFFVCAAFFALAPAGVVLSTTAANADWTDNVFPIKSHNFGTVAVASKTEFQFPIYNTTGREMHIREVRASCGCTTPILSSNYIPAGEKGFLTARFNTPTFRGKKGATLTVVIDQPFYTEVQLKVDGYIRSDMVFHPGSVEFGTINQGDTKTGSTKIYYAGRSDWQVVDIRANQPWLIPKFTQVERGPGKATYELTIAVREDAPAGLFQDEVIVQTNDRSMPRVPLRVSGNVVTSLTISPKSIAFGSVKPGQEIVQRLVITGREPFAIASIKCPGWNVDFDQNDVEKKIHVISVKMTPNGAHGTQRSALTIETAGDKSITATAIVTADVISDQIAVIR
ncbi:DUF1573 domain-containing protein [Aporhodopirellula aestuarii]|uniref:DUF1573 domain-containing protein n=1 Tax=Aporhodopirellula aestuarii TaxID=2950107 RepID=A0ABT0U1H3_9BACT|nr:DUF1573 domain-containing protein [Aporhodopirellula aestuarii]MCM2370405.1 DUF1573 domain-containing protein [Aporhodopirellula aestuarii]